MRKFLPLLVLVAACLAWFLIRATTSAPPEAAPARGAETAAEMPAKGTDPALAAPANDGDARGTLSDDGAASSARAPGPLVAPGWEPGIPPEIADVPFEMEPGDRHDPRLHHPGGAYFDAKYAGLDAAARRAAIAVLEQLVLEESQRIEPRPKGEMGLRELKLELGWLSQNLDDL